MEITKSVKELCDRSVGDVVAEDFRLAKVFKEYGIDFCCGGETSVKDACEAKGIACDDIFQALANAADAPEEKKADHLDVRSWEPDFLASYIVNIHHRYVRDASPIIRELTKTVARVHGATHPETVRISELTDELTRELAQHMADEEQKFFPYVASLCAASRKGENVVNSADKPVEALEHEHDRAGGLIKEIRALSRDFDMSHSPCSTSRIAYYELEKFETDLHRHVHLENNILFPAVACIEQSLAGAATSESATSSRTKRIQLRTVLPE